ncbi:MAG: D-2-hydroxyacid dehydrogenase [Phycisphaerales bacterium]|nr:D-2-hydroxyacid dehydrogenase [Phycisphaerales bacterium]
MISPHDRRRTRTRSKVRFAVKILLGALPNDAHLDQFRAAYPGVQFVGAGSTEEIIREIADADAYFGNPSREAYLAAKQLRWIHAPGAGIEFIQHVPELVDSAVQLTNTRGAHAQTIAEHTFAMLLTLTRNLRFFDHAKGCHTWLREDGYRNVVGIAGKTMVIVGYGNVGRAIGRRAAGFELKVHAVYAQEVPIDASAQSVSRVDQLDHRLRDADILVIATPITPETRGMIGEEQIRLLRTGGYLLAVSRGGIVDEPALIRALSDGHLAGAGLDVTETEPLPPDDPLWNAPNLIITPHVSGGSQLSTELMWSIFFENIGHFVKGEPLKNLTNKRLGY